MKYSRNRQRNTWGRSSQTEAIRSKRLFQKVLRQTERASTPSRLDRWALLAFYAAAGAFVLVCGLVLFAPTAPTGILALAGDFVGQATAPLRDCRIKGNISRNGRIYHVPSGKWYERTRINPAKGERWFCSEAEAQAAGWRPSKR